MGSKTDIWEGHMKDDDRETSWNYECQFKKTGLDIWNDAQAAKVNP